MYINGKRVELRGAITYRRAFDTFLREVQPSAAWTVSRLCLRPSNTLRSGTGRWLAWLCSASHRLLCRHLYS